MESATLGLPDTREQVIALNTDHSYVCKFASEDDEGYKHVSAAIVDLANSATTDSSVTECTSASDLTLVANEHAPKPSFCRLVDISKLSRSTANQVCEIVTVPYSRNPSFVDRKPIIQQLKNRFMSVDRAGPSRLALFGLGGVG